MPRCFILNRVSTQGQKDNLSISVQRSIHPRIADQLGCTYTRADIFDLDVSSTTYDRGKWNAVKEAIASGRYANGYGIFGSIDRYHRDKDEWFEFLTQCLRQKITIAIPDAYNVQPRQEVPVQLYNPDKFKDLIQLVFEIEEAENFKRKFRKKVLLAFSQARESGIDIFGVGGSPYGLKWNPSGKVMHNGRAYGKFEIVPEEAKVVRLIFTKKMTAFSMARWLNENGFRSKKSGTWIPTAVSRVRSNLRVAGMMKNDAGEVIRAKNIDPIIPYGEWLEVQRWTKKNERHPPKPAVKYILSGYSYCGECHDKGEELSLVRQNAAYNGKDNARLYCYHKKFLERKSCAMSRRSVSLLSLLKLVNEDLGARISDESFLRKALDDYRKRMMKRPGEQQIRGIQEEIQRTERKIQNLVAAIAEGADRSVVINQLNGLKEKKSSLLEDLEELQRPLRKMPEMISLSDAREMAELFASLPQDPLSETLKKVHRAFIEKIYVYLDRAVIHYHYFPASTVVFTPDVRHPRKIDVQKLRSMRHLPRTVQARFFGVTLQGIRYQLKKAGLWEK